jgi:hypothetical protein
MATETAPHILRERVALAEFRFCRLGNHYYDEIPLYKIL